jgi:hypothetical protein
MTQKNLMRSYQNVMTKQISFISNIDIFLLFFSKYDIFHYFSNFTAHMNVIPLGTARKEYELQVFSKRIKRVRYGLFNYIVIISIE